MRHPEALAEIEARFGADAYPHRVLMAEFPEGSAIIPNPVNRIAVVLDRAITTSFRAFRRWRGRCSTGCSRRAIHHWRRTPSAERAIVVYGAGESQLLPVMDENVARFPRGEALQPAVVHRRMAAAGLELGVRGDPREVDAALAHLIAGVEAGGFRWEPLASPADGGARR